MSDQRQSDQESRGRETSGVTRRRLLLSLGAGAVAAGAPREWVRPAVDAIVVPVHAQTSPAFTVICEPIDYTVEEIAESNIIYPGNPLVPGTGQGIAYGFDLVPTVGGLIQHEEVYFCEGETPQLAGSGSSSLPTGQGLFVPEFELTCSPGSTFIVRGRLTVNGQDYFGECTWPVVAASG